MLRRMKYGDSGFRTSAARPPVSRRSDGARRWRPVGSGFAAALAAFVICGVSATGRPAAAPASVMVLYFDNDTGHAEYDSLAKGLADMMITDLSSVPSLRVVEREKLEALLAELKLQRKKYFDPKTAQHIGRGTGASYAITGSFL